MAFSNKAFFLLISTLLLQTAISINPLYTICSNSKNYTINSPYEKNLKNLLGDLYLKTPPTGFGFGSSDGAHGLSLCRGDVTTNDCRTCVAEASSQITKRCPNNKGAIIWYDNCFLKYSDSDFLGKIDNTNRFYMWNTGNTSVHPEIFDQKTKELLNELSNNACETKKMYANGEVEVSGYGKIYGMAQCTRDLSRVDCKKCLDDAVSDLPSCCGGKRGGRVVGGSCNIRYEVYPFLNL